MVKEYKGTYTFPFKWDFVAAGFWVKYPNPFSNHVLSEDTVNRYLTRDNQLISKRLLVKTKNFNVPKWAEKFVVNIKHVYVLEESICDPISKTLTTYTKNSTMTSFMTVEEKCVYTCDPSDENKTICVKEAHISSPLFGLSAALEQFGLMKFKKNADKASKGLIYILENFKAKRDSFFIFSKS